MDHCISCSSTTNCLECESGFRVDDGECVPDIGCYARDQYGRCVQCEAEFEFTDLFECNCKGGREFRQGRCQCLDDKIWNGQACVSCPVDCDRCTEQGECLKCREGSRCDLKCPNFYDYEWYNGCLNACPDNAYVSEAPHIGLGTPQCRYDQLKGAVRLRLDWQSDCPAGFCRRGLYCYEAGDSGCQDPDFDYV
jgi:hypothetical protein